MNMGTRVIGLMVVAGLCAPVLAQHAAGGDSAVQGTKRPVALFDVAKPAAPPPPIGGAAGTGAGSCLQQSPDQGLGVISDFDCDLCPGIQVLADQFVVGPGVSEVEELRFWGGYAPSNTPLAVDAFTVKFWTDVGGFPATLINSIGPIPATTRATTGFTVTGYDEYEYTITLPTSEVLTGPATYWVEIYNDTGGDPGDGEDWFWETGTLDTVNGVAGGVLAFKLPESTWTSGKALDLALFVGCKGPCPEDINGDGAVNVLDLIALLLCFGNPALPGCEAEDVNNDGGVDVLDLIDLLLAFGTFCQVNDACDNRQQIFDGQTPFDTTGATTDGPAHALCQFDGQTYHDIWYNYTATCTGNLTVSTCLEDGGDAFYDTDLVVYDGCVCPVSDADLLGCNDDAAGCTATGTNFPSRVDVPVFADNCYKIRVGGFQDGDQGTGTLAINCTSQDFCAGGLPLFDGVTPYNTTGAGTDGPAHPVPPCQFDGQTYHDLWFDYTATCTGNLTVATCLEDGGDAFYDTDLVVYDGCTCPVGDFNLLGCNDDAGGCTATGTPFPSRVVVPVLAGSCYKVRVGGFQAGDQGFGILSTSCVP